MSEKEMLTLRVNGETRTVAAEPHHTLLEVLREELGLTGTKHGCELGECGACTVLLDGVPILSCLTLPQQIVRASPHRRGARERTTASPAPYRVRGRGRGACGYCTPAMLLSAKALLDANRAVPATRSRRPSAATLPCTGYTRYLRGRREGRAACLS